MSQVVRGRWTPADRRAAFYRYVPFDVPEGTDGVRIQLGYDRSRAVLDLGLFDPDGFRGYSGSARTEAVVTVAGATPGYLPGRVPAGTWQLLLGLYEIPEDGAGFEVAIDLGTHARPPTPAPLPPLAPPPPGRVLPAGAGRRWVAGDLHAHTVHSDGALTTHELANEARARGLDYLAVTDHNTVSHHRELPEASRWSGVTLLPGQEVTQPNGHANVLGDAGWVDFRRPADDWLVHAEQAGALFAVNHPVCPGQAWRHPLDGTAHLVEVWHPTWDRRATAPLTFWRARGGVPIGGSDYHRPGRGRRPGEPTTWVEAAAGDVLAGLRAGRVAISADPTAPVVIRLDNELLVDGGDGTSLVDEVGWRRPVTAGRQRFSPGTGAHRLVAADGRVIALTP